MKRGEYVMVMPNISTWLLRCNNCHDEVSQGVFYLGTHFCKRCGAYVKYPEKFYAEKTNIYVRQFMREEEEIEKRLEAECQALQS